MKNFLLIIFLLSFCPAFATSPQLNWYENLIFSDKSFSYEFARTIGYSYAGGADIGECINTGKKIPSGNIQRWYEEWLNQANGLYQLGERLESEKNYTSAQELYFRASNYYRTASFYMDAPSLRPRAIKAWEKSRIAFLKAIFHLPYIRTVSIPYEKTKLPGYYIATKAKNAPLLIVNTGFDGTAEELYFAVGLAAHKRGYNVLLVEGPGQGELVKLQHIPFRNDWEQVVTPIINYAMHLPNLDQQKIALMGISMGGYLAARAAAYEPRIKALILNGGVYDMSWSVMQNLPPQVANLVQTNPTEFNSIITHDMEQDINANWFFNNGMWTFNVKTPAEVVNILKGYTVAPFIDKIKCHTLVIDSTSDEFFKNQPLQVYNQLKAPKTFLVFTPSEAAQAHCQVGATAISNEKIFNWLDATFNWHPLMIN